MPRKNKTKKEIVSDIQLVNDATRRRSLVGDIIFPYLLKLNDTIAYSKIFLQAYSGLVEGVYEENRKKTTIGHLKERIDAKITSMFVTSKPEQKKELERYLALTEILKDVSIQDMSYAMELGRYIDGYLLNKQSKESIKIIPIKDILG